MQNFVLFWNLPDPLIVFKHLTFYYELTNLSTRWGQMILPSTALVCSGAKAHATIEICKLSWILLLLTRKLLNHFRAFDSKLTLMLKAPCCRGIKEKSIGTNKKPQLVNSGNEEECLRRWIFDDPLSHKQKQKLSISLTFRDDLWASCNTAAKYRRQEKRKGTSHLIMAGDYLIEERMPLSLFFEKEQQQKARGMDCCSG